MTQAEVNSYEFLITWTTSRWEKVRNPSFGVEPYTRPLKYDRALRSNTLTGQWEIFEEDWE